VTLKKDTQPGAPAPGSPRTGLRPKGGDPDSGTSDTAKAPRTASFERNTTETRIAIKLTIEGSGQYKISTGIRFFDHMLELFTRHGAFDLELNCDGDLDVDQHHTVEDVGIALGEVFDRALGDKRGILRAGYFLMPWTKPSPSQQLTSVAARLLPSRPKSARGLSAICKPNW